MQQTRQKIYNKTCNHNGLIDYVKNKSEHHNVWRRLEYAKPKIARELRRQPS